MEKSVVITGANGLIGKALTMHLPTLGWKVYAVDMLDFDLTVPDQVIAFCETFKNVPNIINCFAFNDHVKQDTQTKSITTILDLDVDAFDKIMNVNVTSLFNVCKTFVSNRIGLGTNIINFGASTGIVTARTDMYNGNHKNAAYSISKAAVIHMTRILATHLVTLDSNIRVNCISPGGIEADQGNEFKQVYGNNTPQGRMLRVEELFPAVEFLLDNRNSYTQGANIVVDGGWTIQ